MMVGITDERDIHRLGRQFRRIGFAENCFHIALPRLTAVFFNVIEELLRDVDGNHSSVFTHGVREHSGEEPCSRTDVGHRLTRLDLVGRYPTR